VRAMSSGGAAPAKISIKLRRKNAQIDLDTAPLTDFERRFLQDELISKENANIPPSIGSLADRLAEWLVYEYYTKPLLKHYCPDALYAHEDGWIYIFKLPWCVLRIYCGSAKSQTIPKAGLKTHYTESKPPKHLDACIDQLARVIIALSFEREGAVGLNEVDATLAPYLRHDDLSNPKKLITELTAKFAGQLQWDERTAKIVEEIAAWHPMRFIEQQVQRFYFTLNNIERPTIQSPFSNISFAISYSDTVLEEMKLYWAGQEVGSAADYYDEIKKAFAAFCVMYYVGDAKGRPFTFPIPTVIVNSGRLWKVLESDPALWELFWKTVAVRGSFYFMNTNDDIVHAFCCRLQCNVEKIRTRVRQLLHLAHGVWWKPSFVGSVDYVGLNMPRIAFVAKDEAQLVEMIISYAESARRVLNFLRLRHKVFYRLGLYPVTKYLFEKDMELDYRMGALSDVSTIDLIDDFYYNTIAVVGLAEAASIWILKNRDDYARECDKENKFIPEKVRFRTVWKFEVGDIIKEIIKFYELVLSTLRYIAAEFEEEDGVMYNIEQAPAESASIKLALKDLRQFGKAIEPYIPREVDPLTGNVEYFYTSQNTPPYCTYSFMSQIFIEAMTQPLFTGGVTKILQVHVPFYDISWDTDPSKKREALESLERLSKLIKEIMSYEPAEGRKVVYLAFTPVQNHCNSCGYVWVGDPYKTTDAAGRPCCPRCGSTDVETWSRIVGYYRPIRNWLPGRRAEFLARLKAAEKYLAEIA